MKQSGDAVPAPPPGPRSGSVTGGGGGCFTSATVTTSSGSTFVMGSCNTAMLSPSVATPVIQQRPIRLPSDGRHLRGQVRRRRKLRFRNWPNEFGQIGIQRMTNNLPPLNGEPGENIFKSGYIYAPYIPLVKTPSWVTPAHEKKKTKNSPLEDFVEGVYEEEIEAGELSKVRKDPPVEDLFDATEFRIKASYKFKMLNPDYFKKVTIADLS